MKDFSAFLNMWRCKNLAHKMYGECLSEDLFCHFFTQQSTSFLISTLNFQRFSGGVEGGQLQLLLT